MEPHDPSPRQQAEQAIRTLQRYWRGVLCLPVVYLLTCAAIQHYVFEPRDSSGFFPLASDSEIVLLAFFCVLTGCGQILIWTLKARFEMFLDESAEQIEEFVRILKRRFLFLGTICDTISGLGLIYFLLMGDMRAMLGFGAASYVLYAQIYTHERLARKIPAASHEGNGVRPPR